jgi:hypothetical protein
LSMLKSTINACIGAYKSPQNWRKREEYTLEQIKKQD